MNLLLAALLSTAVLAAPAAAAPAPAPFVPVPHDSKVGPALPEGVLRPLAISKVEGSAFFLIEESVVRRGDEVDFWILLIMDPPRRTTEGMLRQGLIHMVLDCKARTARKLFYAGYGDTGSSLSAEAVPDQPGEVIEPNTGPYFQANVLCDGDDSTKDRSMGAAQALEDTKEALARMRAGD